MNETPTTTTEATGDTVTTTTLERNQLIRAQRVTRKYPQIFRIVDPTPLPGVTRPDGWTMVEAVRIYNYGKPYVDCYNVGEYPGREFVAILETDSIELLDRRS